MSKRTVTETAMYQAILADEHLGYSHPVCGESDPCDSCAALWADQAARALESAPYGGTGTVTAEYIAANGPWA